jgi:hypothetical protein
MLYTKELNELLEKNRIYIPEPERQAHELALAAGKLSLEPFNFPDLPHSQGLAFYNIPSVGPSIALSHHEKSGRHGSVTQHLASTGKDFALKTVKINSPKDLEFFMNEHAVLKARGLLEWFEWPQKIGDTGKLTFPFYKGVTIREYLANANVENDIELALLIIEEVKKLHAVGYVHKSLHDKNILVANVTGLEVHIVDYGRSKPINLESDSPFRMDILMLSEVFEDIFEGNTIAFDLIGSQIVRNLLEWMAHVKLKSFGLIENTLKLVNYLRGKGTLENRDKKELLDFLFVAMNNWDNDLLKKVANQIVKDFGGSVLDEECTEGYRSITILENACAKSDNKTANESLAILKEAAVRYKSGSPSVLSFSANSGALITHATPGNQTNSLSI